MDDEGSIRSKYQRLVYGLLFLGSLILLILSSAVAQPESRVGLSLFAVGTAIMASTLLSAVHAILGTDIASQLGRRMEFNKRVYNAGLEAIHLRPAESIFDLLETAESIDMLGVTLRPTYQRYEHRLLTAIERHGCKVRIIIADPAHSFWADSTVADGFGPGIDHSSDILWVKAQIEKRIEELKHRNPPLPSGGIELRYYPSIPTCSIIIVDNEISRLTPYLPYAISASAPKYDMTRERGTLFDHACRQPFDRAWLHAQQIVSHEFGPTHRISS